VLGSWVASTPEVDAKLLFDRHSQHHAWRAEQWWDRLPVLADVDREALVMPPAPHVAVAADHLAGLQGTVSRLAGVYRMALPHLAGAYQRHRNRANPMSDAAVIRTLDLLQPDVHADWREGELLVQDLLTDADAVDAAATAVATLERLLVAPSP
jgi:hypothetical protein